MTEAWKPIVGYEGRYDVSNRGAVRSWLPHNGWPVPRNLSPAPTEWGYLTVVLYNAAGTRRTRKLHHLVLEAFVGSRPDGLEARHGDGDQQNNALSNLSYSTHSENLRDKVRHGTDHQAKKTHCPRQHPYDDANTYRRGSDGSRGCKTCRRESRAMRRTA